MKNIRIAYKMTIIFAMMIVALVSSSLMILSDKTNLAKLSAWTEHTYKVINGTNQMMAALYVGGMGGDILAWLMAAFVAMAGTYVYGTLLTARGAMRSLNLIFAGGIAANILLNVALIPRMGALGAAIATAATQWAAFLAQTLLAQSVLKLKTDLRALIRYAAFTGALAAQCTLFYYWAGPEWIVKFLLCVCAGIWTAFIFRLIRRKDIQQLLTADRSE